MTTEPPSIVSAPATVPYRAVWVPTTHHALVSVGHVFDAVRIVGRLAVDVADVLTKASAGPTGPIIWDARKQYMHYLVPAGDATARRWPPGIRVLGGDMTAVIGVPALWGNTWPLSWRSIPTRDMRFVDTGRLHEALCEVTGWDPAGHCG